MKGEGGYRRHAIHGLENLCYVISREQVVRFCLDRAMMLRWSLLMLNVLLFVYLK